MTTGMATTNKLFGGSMMSPIVDPYPVYRRLRDEQPALPVNTIMGVNHMITRYDDVPTILKDGKTYLLARQRARHRHRHGPHHPRDGGQGARPPPQPHRAVLRPAGDEGARCRTMVVAASSTA